MNILNWLLWLLGQEKDYFSLALLPPVFCACLNMRCETQRYLLGFGPEETALVFLLFYGSYSL